MKYIKLCIIVMVMILLKINVNAASLGLSLSCPATAYSGTNIKCVINANANDGSINGINANYSLENASYSSFSPANSWGAYNNSVNGFAIGNISGISGSNIIGTLDLHVSGNSGSIVNVALIGIGASDMDYNDITAPNAIASISIIEKPTTTTKKIITLNNLIVEGYDIKFNKYTLEYVLDVEHDIDKLNIKATSDRSNVITGIGEVNINEGENKFLITVTNPASETTTYTIIVNRVEKASNVVENNIDQIINAYKSNKELTVNLNSDNDELVVSKSIMDIIKNTDKKIKYNIIKEKNVLYYYEFNGERFTETYNDINLELNFISEDKKIEEKISDNKKLVFENVHKGYFPEGTTLNIKNNNQISNNKNINLYKSNIESNLELISNKVNITENNYLSFEIEKGGKYVISNKDINSKSYNAINIITSIIIFIEIIIITLLIFKKIKNYKPIKTDIS